MWSAFLDTVQRDFVEAQASSEKAPPRVTTQQALLEAQASSGKAPFFVHPTTVATRQWAIETGSVRTTIHVFWYNGASL